MEKRIKCRKKDLELHHLITLAVFHNLAGRMTLSCAQFSCHLFSGHGVSCTPCDPEWSRTYPSASTSWMCTLSGLCGTGVWTKMLHACLLGKHSTKPTSQPSLSLLCKSSEVDSSVWSVRKCSSSQHNCANSLVPLQVHADVLSPLLSRAPIFHG